MSLLWQIILSIYGFINIIACPVLLIVHTTEGHNLFHFQKGLRIKDLFVFFIFPGYIIAFILYWIFYPLTTRKAKRWFNKRIL